MVNRFYYIIFQFKIVTSHLPPPLLSSPLSAPHQVNINIVSSLRQMSPPALGCRDNYYLQHQLGWRGIIARA